MRKIYSSLVVLAALFAGSAYSTTGAGWAQTVIDAEVFSDSVRAALQGLTKEFRAHINVDDGKVKFSNGKFTNFNWGQGSLDISVNDGWVNVTCGGDTTVGATFDWATHKKHFWSKKAEGSAEANLTISGWSWDFHTEVSSGKKKHLEEYFNIDFLTFESNDVNWGSNAGDFTSVLNDAFGDLRGQLISELDKCVLRELRHDSRTIMDHIFDRNSHLEVAGSHIKLSLVDEHACWDNTTNAFINNANAALQLNGIKTTTEVTADSYAETSADGYPLKICLHEDGFADLAELWADDAKRQLVYNHKRHLPMDLDWDLTYASWSTVIAGSWNSRNTTNITVICENDNKGQSGATIAEGGIHFSVPVTCTFHDKDKGHHGGLTDLAACNFDVKVATEMKIVTEAPIGLASHRNKTHSSLQFTGQSLNVTLPTCSPVDTAVTSVDATAVQSRILDVLAKIGDGSITGGLRFREEMQEGVVTYTDNQVCFETGAVNPHMAQEYAA